MIGDVAKTWIIAELAACTGLRALTGSPGPVWSANDDLPSRTGVYVGTPRGARVQAWADEGRIELHIVSSVSEQHCFNMLRKCREVVNMVPGAPRTWLVNPSTKNLQLKMLRVDDYENPDAATAASGATFWVAKLTLTVRGRSSTFPVIPTTPS